MSEDMPRSVKVSDEEILSKFDDVPSPVATVPDLAERLELGKDSVRERLKSLEEDGIVKSYAVGARAVVWWRTG